MLQDELEEQAAGPPLQGPGSLRQPSQPHADIAPPPPPLALAPPAGSVMDGWGLAGGRPQMNSVYRLIRMKELQHHHHHHRGDDPPPPPPPPAARQQRGAAPNSRNDRRTERRSRDRDASSSAAESGGRGRGRGGAHDSPTHRDSQHDGRRVADSAPTPTQFAAPPQSPPLRPTGHPAVDRVVRIRQIKMQRRQREAGLPTGTGSDGRAGYAGPEVQPLQAIGPSRLQLGLGSAASSAAVSDNSGSRGGSGDGGPDLIEVTLAPTPSADGGDLAQRYGFFGGASGEGGYDNGVAGDGGYGDGAAGSNGVDSSGGGEAGGRGVASSSSLLREALMSDLSLKNPVYRMIRKHELLRNRHHTVSGGGGGGRPAATGSNSAAAANASVATSSFDPWAADDFADVMLGGLLLPPVKRADREAGEGDVEHFAEEDEDAGASGRNAGLNPVMRLIRKKQLQRRLRLRGRLAPGPEALRGGAAAGGTDSAGDVGVGGAAVSAGAEGAGAELRGGSDYDAWEIGPGDAVGGRAMQNPVYRLIRKKQLQRKRAAKAASVAPPSVTPLDATDPAAAATPSSPSTAASASSFVVSAPSSPGAAAVRPGLGSSAGQQALGVPFFDLGLNPKPSTFPGSGTDGLAAALDPMAMRRTNIMEGSATGSEELVLIGISEGPDAVASGESRAATTAAGGGAGPAHQPLDEAATPAHGPPRVSDDLAASLVGDRSHLNHVYRLIRKKEIQMRRRSAAAAASADAAAEAAVPPPPATAAAAAAAPPSAVAGGPPPAQLPVPGTIGEWLATFEARAVLPRLQAPATAAAAAPAPEPPALLHPFDLEEWPVAPHSPYDALLGPLGGADSRSAGVVSAVPGVMGARPGEVTDEAALGSLVNERVNESEAPPRARRRRSRPRATEGVRNDVGEAASVEAAEAEVQPIRAEPVSKGATGDSVSADRLQAPEQRRKRQPKASQQSAAVTQALQAPGEGEEEGVAVKPKRGRGPKAGSATSSGVAERAEQVGVPVGGARRGRKAAPVVAGELPTPRRRRIEELKALLRAKLLAGYHRPASETAPVSHTANSTTATASEAGRAGVSIDATPAGPGSARAHALAPSAAAPEVAGAAALPAFLSGRTSSVAVARRAAGGALPPRLPQPPPGLLDFFQDAQADDLRGGLSVGKKPAASLRRVSLGAADAGGTRTGTRTGGAAAAASGGAGGREVSPVRFSGVAQLWRAMGIQVGPAAARERESLEELLAREGIGAGPARRLAHSEAVLLRRWRPSEVMQRLRGLQRVLAGPAPEPAPAPTLPSPSRPCRLTLGGGAATRSDRGSVGGGAGGGAGLGSVEESDGGRVGDGAGGGVAEAALAAAKQPNLLTRSPEALEANLAALGEALGLDRRAAQSLARSWPSLLELRSDSLRPRLCGLAAELDPYHHQHGRPAAGDGDGPEDAGAGAGDGAAGVAATASSEDSYGGEVWDEGEGEGEGIGGDAADGGEGGLELDLAVSVVRRYPPALALTPGAVAARVRALAEAIEGKVEGGPGQSTDLSEQGEDAHVVGMGRGQDACVGDAGPSAERGGCGSSSNGAGGPAAGARSRARALSLIAAQPGLLGCSPGALAARWRALLAAVAAAEAVMEAAEAQAQAEVKGAAEDVTRGEAKAEVTMGAAVARATGNLRSSGPPLSLEDSGAEAGRRSSRGGGVSGKGRPRSGTSPPPPPMVMQWRRQLLDGPAAAAARCLAASEAKLQRLAFVAHAAASTHSGAADAPFAAVVPVTQTAEARKSQDGARSRVPAAADCPVGRPVCGPSSISLSTLLALSNEKFAERFPGFGEWCTRRGGGLGP